MDSLDHSELSRRLLEIPLFREINNVLRGQAGPVDWKIAGQIAEAVAASGTRSSKPSAGDLEELRQACRIAELAVVGHSGLGPVQGVTDVRLLWRTQWAQLNLDSLKPPLERLAGKVAGGAANIRMGLAAPLISAVTPFLMGTQMGFMVGHLSHKALGVWDLGLPRMQPGRLYFNFPNVVEVERDLQLEPQQFRMWLALHEVSHELLFQAVSWMRPHLTNLVQQYMDAVEFDSSELASRLGGMNDPEELSSLMQRPEDLLPLLRSPAQEVLVERIQCFSTAAEGYSDWILTKAGRGLTESFDKIQEGMTRRRAERSSPERMFEKMFGLDLGNEQKRRGHRFVATIAAAGELEHLWEKPENLPDLSELAQPHKWLTRVGTA